MIILDTTVLLTGEVYVDHAVSEIHFLSPYLVHGIGTRFKTKHVKSQQTFLRKRIFMFTVLKVSFLVQKCVFYWPEPTGKGWPRGIETLSFWNKKMKYINL